MNFKIKKTYLMVMASLLSLQAHHGFAEQLSLTLEDSNTHKAVSSPAKIPAPSNLQGQAKMPTEQASTENEIPSLTWPLLPGETLSHLAALFYPDNKAMQKRFIENALLLSRDINPNFNAQVSYNQTTTIIIPELRDLSLRYPKSATKKSSRLKMSYRIASEVLEEVTPAMQAEYEYLTQRNENLKKELEGLNQRIANLQAHLEELKKAALLWLERQTKFDAEKEKMASAPTLEAPPVNKQTISEKAPETNISKPVTPPTSPVETSLIDTIFGAIAPVLEYKFWLLGLLAALGFGFVAKNRVRPIKNFFEEDIKPLTWGLVSPKDEINEEEEDAISRVFQGDPTTLLKTTVANHEMELAVEKAQQLMLENKPNQAIELLQSAIHSQPKNALHPWLYLLDVYRQLDKKSDFMHLAKRFHETYNVMVPQWEAVEVNMVVAMSLEEFPHIIEQISELWETEQIESYLSELISDNRDGERAGFSISVLQELVLLKDIQLIKIEAELT